MDAVVINISGELVSSNVGNESCYEMILRENETFKSLNEDKSDLAWQSIILNAFTATDECCAYINVNAGTMSIVFKDEKIVYDIAQRICLKVAEELGAATSITIRTNTQKLLPRLLRFAISGKPFSLGKIPLLAKESLNRNI